MKRKGSKSHYFLLPVLLLFRGGLTSFWQSNCGETARNFDMAICSLDSHWFVEPNGIKIPIFVILSLTSFCQITAEWQSVGLQGSGDWPPARHIGRCDALPANHRCAVDLYCHCRERNLDYLNWFCTRNCGAGRPHVGLCPAHLVYIIIIIFLLLLKKYWKKLSKSGDRV